MTLSLKERRFALEYVKDPESRPSEIVMKITNKKIKQTTAASKAKRYLDNPEVRSYIEKLQADVAAQLNLSQKKQIKKLQKIYKSGMQKKIDAQGNSVPINLSAATSALATINGMTGLDQVTKEKIEIDTSSIDYDDSNYAEKILMQIMGQYMNRTLDKEDLEALMKSLDTLAQYRIGAKVEEQLDQLTIKKGGLFNA